MILFKESWFLYSLGYLIFLDVIFLIAFSILGCFIAENELSKEDNFFLHWMSCLINAFNVLCIPGIWVFYSYSCPDFINEVEYWLSQIDELGIFANLDCFKDNPGFLEARIDMDVYYVTKEPYVYGVIWS